MKNIVFVLFILQVFVRSQLQSIPMNSSVIAYKWTLKNDQNDQKALVFYNISQRYEIQSQKLSTLKNATIRMENGSTILQNILLYQPSKVNFRLTSSFFRKTKNSIEKGEVDVKLNESNPVSQQNFNEFYFEIRKQDRRKYQTLNFYYLILEEDKKFMKINKQEKNQKCPNEVCQLNYTDFSDMPKDTKEIDVYKKTWTEKPSFNTNLLISDVKGLDFDKIQNIDSFNLSSIRIQIVKDASSQTRLPLTIHSHNNHMILVHVIVQAVDGELEWREEVIGVIEPSSSLQFIFQLPEGLASAEFSVGLYNSTENTTYQLTPNHIRVDQDNYIVYQYKGTQVFVKSYWPIFLCLLFVVAMGILIYNRGYIRLRLLEWSHNRTWRQQSKDIGQIGKFGTLYQQYLNKRKEPQDYSKRQLDFVQWAFQNYEYQKKFLGQYQIDLTMKMKYDYLNDDFSFFALDYEETLRWIFRQFNIKKSIFSDYSGVMTKKLKNSLVFIYTKRAFIDSYVTAFFEVQASICKEREQSLIQQYHLQKYKEAYYQRQRARITQMTNLRDVMHQNLAELYKEQVVSKMGRHNVDVLNNIDYERRRKNQQNPNELSQDELSQDEFSQDELSQDELSQDELCQKELSQN